jgi:ABC-type polysaccharide/polyol phosphate export permease
MVHLTYYVIHEQVMRFSGEVSSFLHFLVLSLTVWLKIKMTTLKVIIINRRAKKWRYFI